MKTICLAFKASKTLINEAQLCQVGTLQYNMRLAKYNMDLVKYNVDLVQYNIGLAKYNVRLTQYNVHLAQYNVHLAQYSVGLVQYNVDLAKYDMSRLEPQPPSPPGWKPAPARRTVMGRAPLVAFPGSLKPPGGSPRTWLDNAPTPS